MLFIYFILVLGYIFFIFINPFLKITFFLLWILHIQLTININKQFSKRKTMIKLLDTLTKELGQTLLLFTKICLCGWCAYSRKVPIITRIGLIIYALWLGKFWAWAGVEWFPGRSHEYWRSRLINYASRALQCLWFYFHFLYLM